MPEDSEGGVPPDVSKESSLGLREGARPQGAGSLAVVQRLVVFLLALWNVFAGLSLTIFQGGTSEALGAGGGDAPAQRLIGVHMLMLAPVFFMLAWKPEKYGVFMWLAYLSQAAIAAATAFDLVTGKLDVEDGALPLVVALIFLALLVYVWIADRRAFETAPRAGQEASDSGEPIEGSDE